MPTTLDNGQRSRLRPDCDCFAIEERFSWEVGAKDVVEYRRRRRLAGDVRFHADPQDVECDAWKRLLELVEEAAANGWSEFAPLRSLPPGDETRIVTLPPTIAKLKAVKRLELYASHLVRIPPEIGQMSNLRVFDPYTSWRLHWFPYEITRCKKLRSSTVSTRVLYGNYNLRPPFPPLEEDTSITHFGSETADGQSTRLCSVCDRPLDGLPHRAWISLRIATDVLPLLVNACSEACIEQLPTPAKGYVQKPHRGGLGLAQPPVKG